MSQLRLQQQIGDYTFQGPYMNLRRTPETDGLYAVVSSDGKQYYLLDVGYAKNIKRACQRNPRKNCWETHRQGNLLYAYFREPSFTEETYKAAETAIRKKYPKIPCGNTEK